MGTLALSSHSDSGEMNVNSPMSVPNESCTCVGQSPSQTGNQPSNLLFGLALVASVVYLEPSTA